MSAPASVRTRRQGLALQEFYPFILQEMGFSRVTEVSDIEYDHDLWAEGHPTWRDGRVEGKLHRLTSYRTPGRVFVKDPAVLPEYALIAVELNNRFLHSVLVDTAGLTGWRKESYVRDHDHGRNVKWFSDPWPSDFRAAVKYDRVSRLSEPADPGWTAV